VNIKYLMLTIVLIPPAIAVGIALLFMAYVMWPLALTAMVGYIIYQAIKAYSD